MCANSRACYISIQISFLIFIEVVELFNHTQMLPCDEYITPELFLSLMTSLFTFYVVYFPVSFFGVCIIIFLPVVPVIYIIHT